MKKSLILALVAPLLLSTVGYVNAACLKRALQKNPKARVLLGIAGGSALAYYYLRGASNGGQAPTQAGPAPEQQPTFLQRLYRSMPSTGQVLFGALGQTSTTTTTLVRVPHQWGDDQMTLNPAQCGMHAFVSGQLFMMNNTRPIHINRDLIYQEAFRAANETIGHSEWLEENDMRVLSSNIDNSTVIDNVEELLDPGMHPYFPNATAALRSAKKKLARNNHTQLFLIQNTKQIGEQRSHWISIAVRNNGGTMNYYVMDPIREDSPLAGNARTFNKPLESKAMLEALQNLLEQ